MGSIPYRNVEWAKPMVKFLHKLSIHINCPRSLRIFPEFYTEKGLKILEDLNTLNAYRFRFAMMNLSQNQDQPYGKSSIHFSREKMRVSLLSKSRKATSSLALSSKAFYLLISEFVTKKDFMRVWVTEICHLPEKNQ